jgi:hypothetical protein
VADQTPLTPLGALIVGVLCAACGIPAILSGIGAISLKSTPGTPGWVAVCVGLIFVLAGAAVINEYAIGRGVGADGDLPANTPFGVRLAQYLIGLAIVGLLTIVTGWTAFGPGERHFTMTIAVPFGAQRRAGGDLSGRIAFGVGTVLLVAMLVALGWSGARRLRRVRQADRSNGSSSF